jgi:hypothetical protein
MARTQLDIRPELEDLLAAIGTAKTYSGRPVSPGIMRELVIEVRTNGAGILAPYWLAVLQQGRGPRTSTKDSGLWKRIYAWMERHSMFRATTAKGKVNEAKSLTWFINKYGNEQFRNKAYIDVYNSARERCIAAVLRRYDALETQITKDIL